MDWIRIFVFLCEICGYAFSRIFILNNVIFFAGRPPFDMYNLDIQRFLPMHNNRKFLRDRVHEVPGRLYTIPYPYQEFRTGRAQRTTPIFTKLRAYGARFNQVMGYERAMYFKKEEAPLDLSYFGLGENFKKPTDPITQNESVISAETKVLIVTYIQNHIFFVKFFQYNLSERYILPC